MVQQLRRRGTPIVITISPNDITPLPATIRTLPHLWLARDGKLTQLKPFGRIIAVPATMGTLVERRPPRELIHLWIHNAGRQADGTFEPLTDAQHRRLAKLNAGLTRDGHYPRLRMTTYRSSAHWDFYQHHEYSWFIPRCALDRNFYNPGPLVAGLLATFGKPTNHTDAGAVPAEPDAVVGDFK